MTPVEIRTPAELQAVMRARFPVSDEQWPAVSAPLEPAVVIAGAGSGKTTLMAARVVFLVATGQVRADEVLGLTFTSKAASELATDIRAALSVSGLLPEVASDDDERLEPTVATYNAYAASLLTEQGLRIGHEPDTRVMADASRYQLAGRAVAQHTHQVQLLTDSPKHVIGNLLALDGAMSEHLVAPDEVRAFDARERTAVEAALATERAKVDLQKIIDKIDERAELLRLVDDYRRLKRQLGLMDFSDQIELATRLARQHPDVGAGERAKFRIVLLDEYQDTSVAQAMLLGALFSGPDAAHGRGHAVTAVGDPNQAIYGWRGASVSNILHVGRTFPMSDGSADIPRHQLTVSRRSDTSILEAANHLAQPLYADPDVPLAPLRPAEGRGEGEVRASLHPSAAAELQWLPGEVHAAQQRIASLPEDPREPGTWRRIGVLTRDNATAAEVFDALTADGIPVEIVGLNGLLRLPEVSMVVSTLTLLHDLTANADLLNLLTGPRWAIGPRDLAILGRRARDLAADPDRRPSRGRLVDELEQAVAGADPTEILSLCDALDDPGDASYAYSTPARERLALLSGELRMLRRHSGESLLDLVRLIIDTTGIDVELASSTSEAAAARRDNLDLFVKAVAEFQAIDGDHSLASLLAYLQAEDELGTGLDVATPTEADSVKLLTVHRAKGLEWDAVFLVGVSERKFPTDRSRSLWTSVGWVLPSPLRGDALDLPQLTERTRTGIDDFKQRSRDHEAVEELRLGYVAVTRARHLLSVSSHWRLFRGAPIGPSRYQLAVVEAMSGRGLVPRAVDARARGGRARGDRPGAAAVAGHGAHRRGAAQARGRRARPRRRPGRRRRRARPRRARRGAGLGRRDRAAARRGARRPGRRRPRTAAVEPVGDGRGSAARRPRGLRARPRATDAPTARAGRQVRHPVPRLGGGPVRPAAADRRRRAAGPRRRRHRRRRRPGGAHAGVRGRPVRRPGAPRRRGAVRTRPRRPGGAGPDRRGLRRARRRVPGRRLEDQPSPRRRSAPARPLPAGLGRAHRSPARPCPRRVLLRPHR